jgi:CelD/BcsL family acetyltransferase involved in cellulose biosynthesis
MYLYNSAYDPKYDYLSVGLLSKILCIKESIESGRKTWDFLKGGERYKYDTGGNEIPISNCRIILK